MVKQPAIYILANKKNGTLYTGVTSNIVQRVFQHKEGLVDGFSKRYNCKNVVYVEIFENMEQAILREKQLKGGSRKKKLKLIENSNPEWTDLYDELCCESRAVT